MLARRARWTPSRIASTLPWTTASGVRSSWLTSASSVRRWASLVSSRPAIVLKPRTRSRTGRGAADRAPRPARSSRRPRPARRRRAARRATTRSTGSGDRRRRTRPRRGSARPDRAAGRRRPRARPPAITLRTAATDPDEDDEEHETEQAAEPAHERPATAAPARTALGRPGLARRPPRRRVLGQLAAPASRRSGASAASPRASPGRGRAASRALVREAVADAVDRQQVARRARVGLELAPDVLDVGVDRPLVRLERDAVDGVEELGPGEDPAGLGGERREELELGRVSARPAGRRRRPASGARRASRRRRG